MNEIIWKYGEPLTDENLITEFETKSGFTFPPSFKKLVIEHNGARPDKKIFDTDSDEGHVFGNLLSFNTSDTKNLNIWETNKIMPSDIDSKYIAFAMDAFGNWICFNAEDSSIVFIDHDNSSIENIANDFDAFIDGLYGDNRDDSPIKDDDETQHEEDEESIDNTAQSDEGTINEPTESELVESVTPVKKSIYEDTGIELEEDDLITESFAIENFSKFRDKLYNSESPKCSVTSVNNNSFRIKINNGTAKEYIDVTNDFHGRVSAVAHTLSGNKRVVSSDLMSSAYTKIRKAIIGLFGDFKVVSESYSPIEFGDSSFSRWGNNLIQESVDNKKAKPIYFVFVSEHKPLLSNIIRNVTKSDWTHAGIAFEPSLTKIYTYAIKKGENKKEGDSGVGFIAESINDYANRKSDDVVSVVCGFVPSKKLKQMKDAVKKYEIMSENTTFSWKIIFDFLVGKGKVNTSTEETSYNQVCSSFVQKILSTADIKVNDDGSLVSPESLHEGLFSKKNSVEECWKGIAKDFNEKELKDNLSKFAEKKRTKVIEEEDTSLSEEVEDDEDINLDDDTDNEEEEVSFDDIELDDDDEFDTDDEPEGDFNGPEDDEMSFDEPSTYIEPESIGSDSSPVQNEYDPKELETLNKLISSEINASSEYWNANKETKKPVLSKLYADIGDEERFHTEQLLYAKSQLTGEAYEPHDPEVKKEYEELRAMGMDSESALYTAIDKTTLRSFGDNESVEDTFEEVQESFFAVEYACTTYELYSMIMESNSKVNITRCTSIIMESMIFEAVDTNDKNKHIKLPMNTNPLVAAGKLFVRLLKLIKTLRIKLRRYREKSYKSAQLKHAWIKRHGIKGLFKDGIYLYFYDETRPKLSMINVLYQLIDRVDAALAVICKDFRLGNYNRYPLSTTHLGGNKHIQFTTTKQAVNALLNIHLTKTKLIVTEENEEALEKKFFGETPEKFKDMNDKNRSMNEYNIFDLGLQTAEDFMEKNVNEVMGRLEQMVQDADSIYYKKEQEYKKLDDAMKVVAKTTENIIKAVTNDLAEYTKVDNNCLKAATEEKDNPSPKNPSDPDNDESTEDLNKEHTDHGKDSEHRNTDDGSVIDVDFTEEYATFKPTRF